MSMRHVALRPCLRDFQIPCGWSYVAIVLYGWTSSVFLLGSRSKDTENIHARQGFSPKLAQVFYTNLIVNTLFSFPAVPFRWTG